MTRVLASLSASLTSLIGSLTEAWVQLRIARLRVLLSLLGVAVAVAAMTLVIAVGEVSVTAVNTYAEQFAGRPGTVTVTVNPSQTPGSSPSAGTADAGSSTGSSGGSSTGSSQMVPAAAPTISDSYVAAGSSMSDSTRSALQVQQAVSDFVSRYDVRAWATSYTSRTRFAMADGGASVDIKVVSLQYGILHHVDLAEGRWFRGDESDDASPSLIVSRGFLERLGITSIDSPVTVTSWSPVRTTFTIVGVLADSGNETGPCYDQEGKEIACAPQLSAYALDTTYERWLPADATRTAPSLEVWAGQNADKQLMSLARNDFSAVFGRDAVTVSSNASQSGFIGSATTFTRVVTIAGVFVMILGALGLINISMVTVRQRIHEIGVRRAFGATSRRVFFSIMLESVVATIVAGVVGIGMAVVGLRYLPLETVVGVPIHQMPPFPVSAAVIGLAAASGVGALAGIVPAIVAVRIRPIDAIRF